MASRKQRRRSVGCEIAARLSRFVEAVEHNPDAPSSFTRRTVRLDLKPRRYNPAMVKKVRKSLAASQSVFAQFLGVSASAVRDWEQGLKTPRGAACRLMDEIMSDPDYWTSRLYELTRPVESTG